MRFVISETKLIYNPPVVIPNIWLSIYDVIRVRLGYWVAFKMAASVAGLNIILQSSGSRL